MRDPLVDPVRGDVISYRVKDGGDSVFVAVVTWAQGGVVEYRAVELYDEGESESVRGLDSLDDWRDWSDFTDVAVLRRGDA